MPNKDKPYRLTNYEQLYAVTGKTRLEWLAVLEGWGASKQSLGAIVAYLMEHYQFDQLCAQAIAVDYRWEHPLAPVSSDTSRLTQVNDGKAAGVGAKKQS